MKRRLTKRWFTYDVQKSKIVLKKWQTKKTLSTNIVVITWRARPSRVCNPTVSHDSSDSTALTNDVQHNLICFQLWGPSWGGGVFGNEGKGTQFSFCSSIIQLTSGQQKYGERRIYQFQCIVPFRSAHYILILVKLSILRLEKETLSIKRPREISQIEIFNLNL